jgi:proline iminopeptidase
MRDRYPPIEPYASGWLEVGDGHEVYWETSGNPDGAPAVVLHGGPGSGCGPGMRRWFDPSRYRIILFDQRGCGRSRPLASAPDADLTANTTHHLLADMERLRDHLAVDRWLLFGGSWGCALGLAYAERHPERVSGIVMMGLATGREAEVRLLTNDLGHLFPDSWAAFRDHLPPEDRDGDLATGYGRLLASPDPAVHQAAADAWCRWEDAMMPGAPSYLEDPPEFRLAFARLVTHYFAHRAWLEPDEVLRNAGRLVGIPGVLVQGRLDPNNLLGIPWLLERAWPGVELRLVAAGHDMRSPEMVDALLEATDRLCPSP